MTVTAARTTARLARARSGMITVRGGPPWSVDQRAGSHLELEIPVGPDRPGHPPQVVVALARPEADDLSGNGVVGQHGAQAAAQVREQRRRQADEQHAAQPVIHCQTGQGEVYPLRQRHRRFRYGHC